MVGTLEPTSESDIMDSSSIMKEPNLTNLHESNDNYTHTSLSDLEYSIKDRS